MTKTFPIKPGGKLVMNVDRGSIHITTSVSDRVEVKVTRELKNSSATLDDLVVHQIMHPRDLGHRLTVYQQR